MPEQPPVAPPAAVRLGPGALLLEGDRELPLFAAAIEAYRLPPASWGKCLDGIAGLGFELLEVRVPWSVYERGTGQLDLQGTRPHPQGWSRDLLGFLTACQARGLAVILAPGPVLGRSVAAGGVPERLWADPAIAARGPRGEPLWVPQAPRPFVQPSLASPTFVEAAAAWLGGLSAALAALVYPAGPLVALRLTMQPGSLARCGAYDGDYHPEAVTRYRRFVGALYPEGLPSSYGEDAQASTLEPPSRVSAEPRGAADWLRFKGALEREALARVAAAAPALGGLPILGAQPLGARDGWGTAEAESGVVAASGLELASLRAQPALERRAFERLVGSSRLPHLAELPWGASCYWGPPEPVVQEQRALRALMAGVQGLVFEAVLAHEERVGAPLDLDGRPADVQAHEATRRVLALARDLELHSERQRGVALLERRDERLEGLTQGLLTPALPGLWAALGLDLEALTEPTPASLTTQAAALLDDAGVVYALVSDALDPARWQAYPALVVAGPVDEASAAYLADYEAAGGRVFRLDEHDDLSGLAERLRAEGFDRPALRLRDEAERALRCVVSAPARGDGVIFLENNADQTRVAELVGLDEHLLWDAARGAPLRAAELELAAGELRVLRFRRAPSDDDDASRGEIGEASP